MESCSQIGSHDVKCVEHQDFTVHGKLDSHHTHHVIFNTMSPKDMTLNIYSIQTF